MSPEIQFSTEEAKRIGDQLSIDWEETDFEEFRMGLTVELEHGLRSPETNFIGDEEILNQSQVNTLHPGVVSPGFP